MCTKIASLHFARIGGKLKIPSLKDKFLREGWTEYVEEEYVILVVLWSVYIVPYTVLVKCIL